MNAAFIRVGLSGCDIGFSYFLPRLVGASIAAELLMTGRFIGAERALRVGLASEVVADDELEKVARSYVDDMLRASPLRLRLTKECLAMSLDVEFWRPSSPWKTATRSSARRRRRARGRAVFPRKARARFH